MPKKLANAAKSNEPAEKNATVLQHHDLPTKDPHSGMQSKVSHPEHQETSKKLEENKHITAGSEKTTSHHIEATHDINHQIHEHEEHKMSEDLNLPFKQVRQALLELNQHQILTYKEGKKDRRHEERSGNMFTRGPDIGKMIY